MHFFYFVVNNNLRKRVFMQTLGIVRRMDELGRIVVPKQIRNIFKIKNGDCLEFSIENGKIILNKHNVFNNIDSIHVLIDIVAKTSNVKILITDDNKVIHASGINSNLLKEQAISKKIYNIILGRKEFINNKRNDMIFEKYCYYLISPLIVNGDIIGSIIILKEEQEIDREEMLSATIINKLLINNLEV